MARMQAKSSQKSGSPDLRKVVDNQSVGELLRNARLAQGEDLTQVADGLKIRRAFIEALENDEFGSLPGTAYGIGFARAYADYLDLDSDEIVELFKAQNRAFNDQTQLVFPEPMPGSRVPTGLVIVLSVLLIGAAYGGWTVLSDENRSISDLVPPVPAFLSSLQETASEVIGAGEPVESTVSDESPVADQTPDAAVADDATDQVVDDGGDTLTVAVGTAGENAVDPDVSRSNDIVDTETVDTETQIDDVSAAVTEAQDTIPVLEPVEEIVTADATDTEADTESTVSTDIVSVESEPAVSSAADAIEPSLVETSENTGDAAVENASDDAAIAETTDPAEPDLASESAPDPVIEDAATVVAAVIPEAPSDEITVYGEIEGTSRVSIIARQATWVEISDTDGSVLMSRLLRKGDIYQAPDRAGLTLVTGNAGGLEFRVDGDTVPDIGPIGSVRRDVALSPDTLKAGSGQQ